jgi:hypothetical protein
MFRLLKALNQAMDDNQKAAQSLCNTVDDFCGRPSKLPKPLKSVPIIQTFARPQ